MPDSTSALINQLTNPPNPFQQFGGTIDFANKLMDFRANKAISDIYGQSIDPQTGQVDLGKFNALASQNPAALWKYGTQMEQSGRGLQAQGAGTSAQLQAVQDQLGAQAAFMQPLLDKIVNQHQPVTGAEVSAALANIPPGTIPATTMANINRQLAQIGPDGNASGLVLGGAFSNSVGQQIYKSVLPSYGTIQRGGDILPYQQNPAATTATPGFPTAPQTVTLTPGEKLQQQQWYNTPVQGGYYDKNGQFKEGSRLQWFNDWGVNPNNVRIGPNGELTAPGVPSFQPSYGAGGPPAAQPAAPFAPPSPTQPQPSRTPAPSPTPAPAPAPGPSATPKPPGPGQPTPPTPAPPTGGGTPAMSPTQVGTGEQAYRDATLGMQGSQDRRTTISLALQALPGAEVGGSTDALRAFRNTLSTYAPDFLQRVLGKDYDPVKAATDDALATKYMQQITNATVGAIGGQGTNEKLQATAAATPNPRMPEMASTDVLKVLDAKERMNQYAYDQFTKTGLPPAKFAQWSADWARTHDPRAFMVPFMTPDQWKYLRGSITTPADKKAFNTTVHELVTNGVIPDPTKAPGTTE